MNVYSDSKKNRLKERLAGIEFKVSLVRAIMLGVFFVVLLMWVFFVGIVIGRGDNPENIVPELAAIMPSQNMTASMSNNDDSSNEASQDKIIQPENLEFMDNLKTKPTNDDLTSTPLATNIPPKAKNVPTKPTATEQQTQSQAQADVEEFDYVYQVGASRSKEGSEKLKKKLLDAGFRASILQIEKDGAALYRINVDFRGAPEETSSLSEDLKALGLERKILISKSPI